MLPRWTKSRASAGRSSILPPELLRRRCEDRGKRLEQPNCPVGQGSLRLDVEGTEDMGSHSEQDRELGQDSRKRRDEVGISADVGCELGAAEPNGPAHDVALHAETVRNERVPALSH
jgi:hypothetical protein